MILDQTRPHSVGFRLVIASVLVCALFTLASCENGGPVNQPPATVAGGGINLQTWYDYAPAGFVQVALTYIRDEQFNNYYTSGTEEYISTVTNPNGSYADSVARTPARWSFVWGQNGAYPNCWAAFDNDFNFLIPPQSYGIFVVTCMDPAGTYELGPTSTQYATFSPVAVNLNDRPTYVYATGAGFSATYGPQVVQFYDASGNFVAQEGATTVSSTELYFPTPSLSVGTPPTTPYLGVILNEGANGDYDAVTTGILSVFVAGGCKTSPCSEGPEHPASAGK